MQKFEFQALSMSKCLSAKIVVTDGNSRILDLEGHSTKVRNTVVYYDCKTV